MEQTTQNYWQTIQHSRVAILGIFPPPFGGVSVHIKRVMDCLSLQNNMLLFWPTEQKLRRLLPLYIMRLWWRLIVYRPKYVYYHSTYLTTSIVELAALVLLRKMMHYQLHIVDHDCRHLYQRFEITKRLYRWVLTQVDSVICIGPATKQSYSDTAMTPSHITIEDAFIPPIKRNERLIWGTYPSSLMIFMKEQTPLLLMSAAHLMLKDTKDIYGVDRAIELLAGIADEYPDAGLIIGLPHIKDLQYFMYLQKYMKELKVSERIYILHGNKEIWPLFERIDLFIRPTLSDGDSISVREALHFNVPVVASDVCDRPVGVHCFSIHNTTDAVRVTKKILREYVYGPYRERYYMYAKSMS